MQSYNLFEIVNNQKIWKKCNKRNLFNLFSEYMSYFSKVELLKIVVPKNVYLRTQLICEYIEDNEGFYINVTDFVNLLYREFLSFSIEQYNPSQIHREITRSNKFHEKLKIHANDETFEYNKQIGKRSILSFTIDKKGAEKGRLLLEEMDDLFGNVPSLEEMIAIIWINFIEDYKAGKNKKALQDIVFLVEKYYEVEKNV